MIIISVRSSRKMYHSVARNRTHFSKTLIRKEWLAKLSICGFRARLLNNYGKKLILKYTFELLELIVKKSL